MESLCCVVCTSLTWCIVMRTVSLRSMRENWSLKVFQRKLTTRDSRISMAAMPSGLGEEFMSDYKDNKKKVSPWKSIQFGLAILAGLIVYAYGFQITKVDLEDLRSERRQESLVRVMRALARPEIIAYDQQEEVINSPVYVTCPAAGTPVVQEPDKTGAYILVTPSCANPGEKVHIEGFNF